MGNTFRALIREYLRRNKGDTEGKDEGRVDLRAGSNHLADILEVEWGCPVDFCVSLLESLKEARMLNLEKRWDGVISCIRADSQSVTLGNQRFI